MRILYGAFAQGQGHFSKAAVLVPLLESRGHEVRVVSSGGESPPEGYSFSWHRHFPALSYVVSEGRIDYKRSFRKWLREIPAIGRHLWGIRNLVKEFQPELIVSDFEPLSASPFLDPKCEVIALCRQVALSDRAIPLPGEMAWERKMTRSVIRLFTGGADRLFGYHYEPASYRCVPPIIRADLTDQRPHRGESLFVYNGYHTVDDGAPQVLIDWAMKNNQPVIAYGFPEVERGRVGLVQFQAPSRKMLIDLANSRGVITSAGLTTPLEAFLLGKPVVTVPIPRQWEQHVNSFHLERAGIARHSDTWNYDLLRDMPAPSHEHPLWGWLNTPVEQILDHVLQGTAAATTVESQHRAAA
jgi:uncharacterized protein (TIGR00661 family)